MNWYYRYTVLALCMAAFFITMGARLAISPLIPIITDSFEVTNAQIGVAMTGMWLTYAITQFPSGILADRFGEKPIIMIAVGGTAVSCLLLAISPVFAFFAFCLLLLGGLAGLHYVVGTTLLSRTFDDIGTAVGFHSAGATISGLIVPIVAAWVGVRYGWRPAVTLMAFAALPVFIIILWKIQTTEPKQPKQLMRKRFHLSYIQKILSNPTIIFTLFLAVSSTFVMQGLLSFLPTFLVEYKGQSTALAGVVFSAFFVVNSGGQVGIGTLSDRYGRDPAMVGCMFAASVGLIFLVTSPGLLMTSLGIIFLGVGMSFHPTLLPRFLDELSQNEQGTEFGLVRTAYGILGAAGSIGVGLFADHLGWGNSFFMLIIICFTVAFAIIINYVFSLGY